MEKRYQLIGWLLFLVCALFFVMDSLLNGTALGVAAGVTFLIACFIFLTPLVFHREKGKRE